MITNDYILNLGYYSIFREYKKWLYLNYLLDINDFRNFLKKYLKGDSVGTFDVGYYTYVYDISKNCFHLLFYDFEIFEKCVKLYNANRQLFKRLKKRITTLIKEPSLFLTFDFSDNDLNSTTEKDRRDIISRYCKKQSNNYIANIDFGEQYGREHYHAIVQTDYINLDDYELEGWVKYERVWTENCSAERLASYITKITRHALKDSTKRYRIIYSKK